MHIVVTTTANLLFQMAILVASNMSIHLGDTITLAMDRRHTCGVQARGMWRRRPSKRESRRVKAEC